MGWDGIGWDSKVELCLWAQINHSCTCTSLRTEYVNNKVRIIRYVIGYRGLISFWALPDFSLCCHISVGSKAAGKAGDCIFEAV